MLIDITIVRNSFLLYKNKMNSFERPSYGRDFDLELIRSNDYESILKGDGLRDITDFLSSVGYIVELLLNKSTASYEMHNLEFINQQDDVYCYPTVLSDRLLTRQLDSINLSIVKNYGCAESTTLEIADEDGLIYISRKTNCEEDLSCPDAIIDSSAKVHNLEHVPNYEINAFIMSLAGMYSESKLSLLNPSYATVDAAEIEERLYKNAIKKQSSYEFDLSGERIIKFTTIEDGSNYYRLVNFSIIYEIHNKDRLVVDVDQQNGFSIIFRRIKDSSIETIIPDGGDYIRLIEILIDEMSHLIHKTNKIQTQLESD